MQTALATLTASESRSAAYERLPADEDQIESPGSMDSVTIQDPEPEAPLEERTGDAVAFFCAIFAMTIATAFTWMIVWSNFQLGWFIFHPLLQSTVLPCLTYGILTLQPTARPKTKAAGLSRHQIAMFVGLAALILGTLTIVINKSLYSHPRHFTTWHGTFGIATTVWTVFQVILGAGSVWFGGALFGGGTKAKALWKYHRLSGYLLLPVLLWTAYLGGAWSSWSVNHSSYAARVTAFTLAPLVLLIALFARIRLWKMKFL